MKVLPHKSRRSLRRRKRSTRRSARDPKKCQVQPPEIFVRAVAGNYGRHHYIPAKIRIRRGCYRYLAWRDGHVKREFYLGKIKILAPHGPAAADPELAGAGGPGPARAGVRK